MTTDHVLLTTLGISLLTQAVFFAFAAVFKTDTVTDLSYGLTFVIVAGVALLPAPADSARFALFLMVAAWGIRLAGYLLYRIVHMKRDARFDGIRERFWPFLKFWTMQGLAAWVILLPVTVWSGTTGSWTLAKAAGAGLWLAGFLIEAVADAQKFGAKQRRPDRWVSSGLWRHSRHPNYFGELLCWYGVFVFVAEDLAGWRWVAVAGPLAITILLRYVTGVPPLEAGALRKWGNDPEYRDYRRRTRLLIPWMRRP